MGDREEDVYGPIERESLRTRMLQGAGMIAFMTAFSVIAKGGNGEFSLGQRLMVIPLASLGGAVGGAAYFATDSLRARRGWHRTVANVLSILAYCAASAVLIGIWVYVAVD